MRLYNTLTRKIEDFQPQQAPEVKLYACGPTVYDYAHIGHLRKYVVDDILIRVLKHTGYKPKFVQNITDVGHLTSDSDTGEDKLEKGAKKYGQSVWDIAKKFEQYFWYSMDLMGALRPDISSRATDHIESQLQLVLELEKKGFTYVIKGDGVYFDTSKLDNYGKLARLDAANLKAGARVEQVKGKRNPTDFALWKFERPGENRAMVWESPWAKRSFPGWHVECSAMSMQYLGKQLDIHTGGIDHIPVHHTNEIAQSEAVSGLKPFVRYWVHHNFLKVEGQKMSKSLDNFYTIDDVLEKGFSPRALRLLFLTTHYSSEMNFTWNNLAGMDKSYQKLLATMARFRAEQGRTTLSEDKLDKINEYKERFFGFLEDDLKTPEAVTVMWEVVKSNIPGPDKYDLLIEFDEVLQLGLQDGVDLDKNKKTERSAENIPIEVKKLLEERGQAKEAKNYQRSDELRDKIRKLGFEVTDDPGSEQTIKLKKF